MRGFGLSLFIVASWRSVHAADWPLPNWHGCTNAKAANLPYCDTRLSIEKRLDDLLSRLSLSEKLQQITPDLNLGDACTTRTTGKEDIGLPPWLWLVEANTGVDAACPAVERCVTNFVGPVGMGASFNRTSWRLKGTVLGNEMRALSNIGASRFHPDHKNPVCLTGFGPNINIARDPRFGRNSEVPGEDPLLSGTYAYEMVSGMQERDANGYPKMAAYLKHFTAYSTETNRGHDSYNISAYDFFDTYLPQYERAFKAQPQGVMCSYNAENGNPSCANDWLLNKQLRSWKPDAHVTTDCGAVGNLKGAPVNAKDDTHAAATSLMNGTDLEMGGTEFSKLAEAINQSLATEERVNEAVRRAFRVHFEVGRFDPPQATSWSELGLQDINSSYHQQISFEAALQSFVLLKNEGALPLEDGALVAVVGPQAIARSGLFSDYAASSHCFEGGDTCVPSIADGIALAGSKGRVVSAQGVEMNSHKTAGIAPALDLARSADAVVLALGIDHSIEHEGLDRTDTSLPGLQETFAKQVLALDKPTILIITNGGAVAIDNLMMRGKGESAPYAIVEAFNPGRSGAQALGMSLFGKENRWGKLPITMYPHSYISEQPMINYDMSISPGRTYKYYEGKPLFPFGFGLSMTTFSLRCSEKVNEKVVATELFVSCEVRNTGTLQGDEVVQVYHRVLDVGRVDHPLPKRALVDFVRVSIPAMKEATVSFELSKEHFMVVNKAGVKTLYPGKHQFILSRGCSDDEQTFTVTVPSHHIMEVVV